MLQRWRIPFLSTPPMRSCLLNLLPRPHSLAHTSALRSRISAPPLLPRLPRCILRHRSTHSAAAHHTSFCDCSAGAFTSPSRSIPSSLFCELLSTTSSLRHPSARHSPQGLQFPPRGLCALRVCALSVCVRAPCVCVLRGCARSVCVRSPCVCALRVCAFSVGVRAPCVCVLRGCARSVCVRSPWVCALRVCARSMGVRALKHLAYGEAAHSPDQACEITQNAPPPICSQHL
ncbi:hypothetical protein EV426DRAFT_96273 [Tirmania nivea]|nr:hypothetical protein EV426DRAFT_96273 [Tirmania nivea]